jgi:hypothetical protein
MLVLTKENVYTRINKEGWGVGGGREPSTNQARSNRGEIRILNEIGNPR